MGEILDMKISGAGVMPGGTYDTVTISGSGKVHGDVICNRFRCSGATKATGNLHAREDLSVSGEDFRLGNLQHWRKNEGKGDSHFRRIEDLRSDQRRRYPHLRQN